LRVETPVSIRSITARVSGSRSAKYLSRPETVLADGGCWHERAGVAAAALRGDYGVGSPV
jgi:hypothetical protein